MSSIYTYLLTPWCRDLLEQLTGLQLVKKFPAFHGTRKFITITISKFMYKAGHVDKCKITFKLIINHRTNEIL